MNKDTAVDIDNNVHVNKEMTNTTVTSFHIPEEDVKIKAEDVRVKYGEKEALFGINLDIPESKVTSFIGPSGCGKSTFLRCLNRMNDT
ncbi:MAG: ATP-binding cassette domain-containing protein, partial [Methylocystaceae bacterium]|nr:ATP-binding cassette domain-containing protein [Methylocystaceae bacterium]